MPQDDAEAVKWYRKAAGQSFAPAQHNLGNMYTNGRGVPQNSAEAVKWYRTRRSLTSGLGQFLPF